MTPDGGKHRWLIEQVAIARQQFLRADCWCGCDSHWQVPLPDGPNDMQWAVRDLLNAQMERFLNERALNSQRA